MDFFVGIDLFLNLHRPGERSSCESSPRELKLGICRDMDKEVEFVGVWGILKESIKLLIHHARLLLPLAAILVLPQSVGLLGYTLVTNPLTAQIISNLQLLGAEISEVSPDAGKTERELQSEYWRFVLMLLIYFVFVLAFSLASIAAIVYAVACIYLEKTITFAKVLAVVPRVWKRLMVTFLWMFLILVAYQTIFMVLFSVLGLLVAGSGVSFLPLLLVIIASLAMQLYFSVVWYLANVISVLTERYGIAALQESTRIVKGKRLLGFCLVLIYTLCTGVIGFTLGQAVDPERALISRLLLGSLLVLALTLVHLIGIIVQGLFYFMVKSYHQESIDRMVLSDHLDAYLGEYEYVALKDLEAL